MKIRFCENNKGKGKVVRRLKEEFPDLNIKVKDCLKECSSCGEKPTAKVDKIRITASDGDALYQKILEIIKNQKET